MLIILKICLFNQIKLKPALTSDIFPDYMILKSIWVPVIFLRLLTHINICLFKPI